MVRKPSCPFTTQTTRRFASIAVATTEGLLPNAPSPRSATAARRRSARHLHAEHCRGPNPSCEPTRVMKVPGTVIGNCWPTPFLFQPTSVTMKAVSGRPSEFSEKSVPDEAELVGIALVSPILRKLPAAE